ncbi:MAG: WYL domain-containing protein [Agathobacter sp.]|nr:WYL domain-containing protein [Agathobacter sp.]
MELIKKLKMNTTAKDRAKLEQLIHKEIYHYSEVGSDCKSIIDNIWKITDCIESKNEITISYYKMNRDLVKRRLKPVSIIFTEYYFYLIAYKCDDLDPNTPFYFRIDRITDIIMHRERFTLTSEQNVNEGELRQKSQFMWPGKSRRIRFEFSGPSVQAILDRIPIAKVIDHIGNKSILEAEVYGDGIKMFLLSQGAGVKVLEPAEFVEEMKAEIQMMGYLYS